MSSGSEALRSHAPSAADALDAVVDATWAMAGRRGVLDLVDAAARRTAALHGLVPLAPPEGATVRAADGDRGAVLAFAEQCSLDVAAVTPDQRAAFLAAAGGGAGDLAAALWVVDVVPRARAALDALFGPGPWPVATDGGGHDLWGALDRFVRVVPALDALDPVTSELVRLRGARQHRCRLCMSIRSRPALLAGADEALFDSVDHYEAGGTTPLARAVLALTDAVLWTPGRIDPSVVADVAHRTTPAQQVELVLDVARNALNKVAVALGADAAHVEEGTEVYDVEPDGSLVYGLTLG